MPGLIAIVGRPNVGKSALFNRIVGKRIAIVHDLPGVTRDRITAPAEWQGRPFTLVDTGGIGLASREKASEIIAQAALDQAQIALETADVIIQVVDIQTGILPLDLEVAARLHKAGKPILVAVNKADLGKTDAESADFAGLGFERLFPVSAIHGRGVQELVEAAVRLLPLPAQPPLPSDFAEGGGVEGNETQPTSSDAPADTGPLKLAIVGRPNVGKSSIINALTQSQRVIVSPTPGTTRDAVDVPFEVETDGVRESYILIDTAGMRKSRRVDDSIEFFSVKRAEESIARSDLVILVMDAQQGITEQDKKISDVIVENARACILVVNKWDLFAPEVKEAQVEARRQRNARKIFAHQATPAATLHTFGQWVQRQLFFLDYAPVIFTSATSGFHLDRLLEAVRFVTTQLKQKVPTALLNRTLQAAVEKRQPPSKQGLRLKFYYATQTRQAPPTFLLFVNRTDLFPDAYKKYLTEEMRAAFGYEGCPIRLLPKARPKSIEPIRKYRQHVTAQQARKGPAQRQRKGTRRGKGRAGRT